MPPVPEVPAAPQPAAVAAPDPVSASEQSLRDELASYLDDPPPPSPTPDPASPAPSSPVAATDAGTQLPSGEPPARGDRQARELWPLLSEVNGNVDELLASQKVSVTEANRLRQSLRDRQAEFERVDREAVERRTAIENAFPNLEKALVDAALSEIETATDEGRQPSRVVMQATVTQLLNGLQRQLTPAVAAPLFQELEDVYSDPDLGLAQFGPVSTNDFKSLPFQGRIHAIVSAAVNLDRDQTRRIPPTLENLSKENTDLKGQLQTVRAELVAALRNQAAVDASQRPAQGFSTAEATPAPQGEQASPTARLVSSETPIAEIERMLAEAGI